MKIIFMGTPQFAVKSLDILVKNNFEIPLVVTVPDKPKGRGLQLQQSDVKKYALEHNLNISQPVSLKDESFINKIKSLEPDLIIVVAFRILPKDVYEIPKYGTFNLHASLLPKYRGAAPINHAVINSEEKTGVTTFFLQDKVDTGNIILQVEIPIDENDNAGTLHDKLATLGADTVLKTVNLISDNKVELKAQDDSLATKAPKIFKDNCKIDWGKPAAEIHNLIRGLSPYPAAFTLLENKVYKIYETKLTTSLTSNDAGKFEVLGKNLFINTNDFKIEVLIIQPEGKKPMPVTDFLNGFKHKDGQFS